MSRSWTVARPFFEGDIFSQFFPFLYSRSLKSGLVESVKRGYSIEAVSDFGTASKISQTKKSVCGYRSGSNGFLCTCLLSSAIFFLRYFTHSLILWITPCDLSVLHTGSFGTSHRVFRYFTHGDPQDNTFFYIFFNQLRSLPDSLNTKDLNTN